MFERDTHKPACINAEREKLSAGWKKMHALPFPRMIRY